MEVLYRIRAEFVDQKFLFSFKKKKKNQSRYLMYMYIGFVRYMKVSKTK